MKKFVSILLGLIVVVMAGCGTQESLSGVVCVADRSAQGLPNEVLSAEVSITVKQTEDEPLFAGQTTVIPTELSTAFTSTTGYNPTITWAQYRVGMRNTSTAFDGFIVNSNQPREVGLSLDPLPDADRVQLRLLSLSMRAGATTIDCSVPDDRPELTYLALNPTPPVVGDAMIGFNEQCDDGNAAGGDGCDDAGQYEPAQNLAVVSSGQSGFLLAPDSGTSFWFVEGPFGNRTLTHWSEANGATATGVGPVANEFDALTPVSPGVVIVASSGSATGYQRFDLLNGSTQDVPPPGEALDDGSAIYEVDETVDGIDLNGDGDALDGHPAPEARTGVLHTQAPDGTVTNLAVTGTVEQVVPGGVFVRLREYSQAPNTLDTCFDGDFYTCVLATYSAAADLNADGDIGDTLRYFWSSATGLVPAATAQNFTVIDTVSSGGYLVNLTPGGLAHWQPGADFSSPNNFTPIASGQTTPVLVEGDTYAFTNQMSAGFLKTWSPSTGLVGTGVPIGRQARLGSGGGVVWINNTESREGVDLNGDGDMFDLVAKFWTPSGGLVNTGLAIENNPMWIGGESFSLVVREEAQRADLNGDGDRNDNVMFVYDASAGLTNLEVAGDWFSRVNLADPGAFAFESSEEGDDTDHNGDGVLSSTVIQVVRPA